MVFSGSGGSSNSRFSQPASSSESDPRVYLTCGFIRPWGSSQPESSSDQRVEPLDNSIIDILRMQTILIHSIDNVDVMNVSFHHVPHFVIPSSQHSNVSVFQVARMVIVVAVTFLLAWTPFYLVSFISQVQPISFLRNSNFLFTMLLTHLVGFTNSTINPFVYTILSDKFRNAFKQIAADLCCLRRYRNTCVGRCCLRFLVLGQGGDGANSVRRRSMAADGHSTNRALSQRAISCLKQANSFNNNGHGGGGGGSGVGGESISPDGSTCYRGGEASCFGVTNFASTDSSPPKVHLHQLAEYTVNLSSRPIGLLTTAMNCVTAPDSEQLVVTAAKSVVTPFAEAAASASSAAAAAKTAAHRSDASSRSDGQSSSYYPSSNPHPKQLPNESMKPQLLQSTDEEAAGQHQQHQHRSYEGRTCQHPTSSKSSNDWLLSNRKSY